MDDFAKAMLNEVRVRRLPLHKLESGTARRLSQAGLIRKWDVRENDWAHHSSNHCHWRITDEGLKVLGKERVW